MGHVLGLRHNFAGSSTTGASDIDFSKQKITTYKGPSKTLPLQLQPLWIILLALKRQWMGPLF